MLFPTGTLPGPRWRVPVALLIVLSGIGLAAWGVRPGPMAVGRRVLNPIGIDGWPSFLQPFVDALPLDLFALFVLAAAALITRYRRGDRIERLQIRWLVSAVTVCVVGFAGTAVDFALHPNDAQPVSLPPLLVAYGGILAMPIAIGIAVTRYRLYEIDRIISRTLGWATVSGVIVALFAGTVVGLQALLAGITQSQTIPVAASTLVAFALFQPVRRRVQSAVDRRFDRARYDAERTATDFASVLRDEVELAHVQSALLAAVDSAIGPQGVAMWIRGGTR
jgi:hypothetical protein